MESGPLHVASETILSALTKIPKHWAMCAPLFLEYENEAAQRTLVKDCLNKRDSHVSRVDVKYLVKSQADASIRRIKLQRLFKSPQQFEGCQRKCHQENLCLKKCNYLKGKPV